MKPKSKPFRHSVAGAMIIAATFSLANHSQAASGDWNVDADGFWNTAIELESRRRARHHRRRCRESNL